MTDARRPLDLDPQRLKRITVCIRPFRRMGPRVEKTMLGDKTLVHNYGHGGAGWSLSWGCAEEVSHLVGDAAEVAVIGAGALGLTTAVRLAEAGAKVTVYADAFGNDTRSARATGSWSPDSRLAIADAVAPDFADRWQRWARASHMRHHAALGESATASYTERFLLRDHHRVQAPQSALGTVALEHLVLDLQKPMVEIQPQAYGFTTAFGKRTETLTFDIGLYIGYLLNELDRFGAERVSRHFVSAEELTALSQPILVNCTGYGAKTLFGDDDLIPVRGQIGWLPPHDGPLYGISYRGGNAIARPDGVIVQNRGAGDDWGHGVEDETPDRQEFLDILAVLRPAFASI